MLKHQYDEYLVTRMQNNIKSHSIPNDFNDKKSRGCYENCDLAGINFQMCN